MTNHYHLADEQSTPPTSSSYWVVQGSLLGGAYPGAPVVTGMKKDTTMRTRMGASRKFERAFKRSQSSPFRLRLRIGPRPAFHGGGATVKVEGAAPFVEPERRLSGPDFHARFSAELVPFLLRVTTPEPERHEKKIRSILNAGVRTLMNLIEPDETDAQGRPFAPYRNLVRQLCPDATCVRFPIRDLCIPTTDLMATILDTIDESLKSGRPVYVHCWGGVGRTGTVIGCWLLRHEFATHDNVFDVLARLRQLDRERGDRNSPETEEQWQFVLDWGSS